MFEWKSIRQSLLAGLVSALVLSCAGSAAAAARGGRGNQPDGPDDPAPSGALKVPQRQAEPQGPQVADTEKLVRDLFKAEYAKRSPDDRQSLARTLLDQAGKAEDDLISRYVCLREARDIAVQAGDAGLAMEAIDGLALYFVIDEMDMRLKALNLAAAAAPTPALCEMATSAALGLIDGAVANDEYEKVAKLATLAESTAARTRNQGFIDHVREETKEFQALRAEFGRVKIALDKLQASPADPNANANGVVGRFFCLRKGNWDKGLPYLARGNEAPLAAAAAKDLTGPLDARSQAEAGDLWWDLSEKMPPNRAKLRDRAAWWYGKAAPTLAGLQKTRVDARLAILVQDKPLSGRITILRAAYGTNRTNIDVTAAMRKMLEADPFMVIQPGRYISGSVDRWAFGRRLQIEISIDGRTEMLTLSDDRVSTIPPIPSEGLAVRGAPEEFTIVAARYGAEASWIDVTAPLRAALRDPKQEFEFKSSLAPRDPAPRNEKHFVVWYDHKGQRRVQVIMAGDRHRMLYE